MSFNTLFKDLKSEKVQSIISKGWFVFGSLWLITFLLYLPAVEAGRVGDYTEWFEKLKILSFWKFINWNIAEMAELYQFTQLVTYILYKLFGAGPWVWYIIHITLNAANCYLFYTICTRLFEDTGLKNVKEIAFFGVLLLCVSPQLNETIVYKPSFHFLLGLTMLLSIVLLAQQYLNTGKERYAWYSGVIYLLSIFSLELFIVTPCVVVAMGMYYSIALGKKVQYRKMLYDISMPHLMITILYFVIIDFVFINRHPHNAVPFTMAAYAGKTWKYLYHLLFFGRYFSTAGKDFFYKLADKNSSILLFYILNSLLFVYIAIRIKKMQARGKLLSLFYVFCMITMLLLSILWFPDQLLILSDRYAYILIFFLFMLISLLVSAIPRQLVRIGIISGYVLLNIIFTVKVVSIWSESAKLQFSLLKQFPDPGNKTVLMLSLPQCLQGAIIMPSKSESEFKYMYNTWNKNKLTNQVYDVASYNLLAANNGTRVVVFSDSTIQVLLNQWGSWWWYDNQGARYVETKDYKIDMEDVGQKYNLTLKRPYKDFLLVFENKGEWRVVDMEKKNIEQY